LHAKITILTENNHAGGLDVFIANLLNNWPDDSDEFVLICNASHPGIDIIQRRLRRQCTIVRHKIARYVDLVNKFRENKIINATRMILSPLLRYAFFSYYVWALRGVLGGHDSDKLLIVNGGYPGGDMCRAAALVWSLILRKGQSIHNFHNLVSSSRVFERLPESIIDRAVSRCTRRFVTVSNASALSASIRPGMGPVEKIRVIYNGVDEITMPCTATATKIKMELGIPVTANICLMLATYEVRKGHKFLFDAFQVIRRSVPNARLVVCGYGLPHEVERVKRLLKESNLEKFVTLLPFRNDVATLFAMTDVLMVPSQGFESFGLTSIEAMSCGVPVVATRVGGIPEVVADGEGGYCVDANDIAGFAAIVVKLLRDRKLRQNQSSLGRKRYRHKFTAATMASAYQSEIFG
jgi:glycosyltransferase involved in cell wall biosynthesis